MSMIIACCLCLLKPELEVTEMQQIPQDDNTPFLFNSNHFDSNPTPLEEYCVPVSSFIVRGLRMIMIIGATVVCSIVVASWELSISLRLILHAVDFVIMLLYFAWTYYYHRIEALDLFDCILLFISFLALVAYQWYNASQRPESYSRSTIDPEEESKEYVNVRPTYVFLKMVYRGWCEGCEMWCPRHGFGMSTQGRCTCSTDECWSCRQKQAPGCTQCAIPAYDYATLQPLGYLPYGAKVRVVGVNVKDGQNSTMALIDCPYKAVVRIADIQDCGLCIPLNAPEHEAERLCFEALDKALHNFPEEIVNTIQQFVGKFNPECPLNLVRKTCTCCGLILHVDPTSTLDYGEAKREIEELEGWFDSKNQLLPKEKLVCRKHSGDLVELGRTVKRVEIDQFMTGYGVDNPPQTKWVHKDNIDEERRKCTLACVVQWIVYENVETVQKRWSCCQGEYIAESLNENGCHDLDKLHDLHLI